MIDCGVQDQCIRVLHDLPDEAASSASPSALLAAAGTWLDAGDPLISKLPLDAVADHCGPGSVVAAIYFCGFVVLCGLILLNFVVGGEQLQQQNHCGLLAFFRLFADADRTAAPALNCRVCCPPPKHYFQ